MAWGAWLHRSEHLLETSGLIHGASYADVYGRMPAALLLVVAGLVGAALAAAARIRQSRTGRSLPPSRSTCVASIGGEGYSSWCSASSSRPTSRCARRRSSSTTSPRRDARSRSTPSTSAQLSGDARLTPADIERNAATLENVRLWDHAAAARDVRPDPGDPHLLRLRLGRQRPLPHRRRAAAGDALGARAQLGQPARTHLGQRAADVHARLRPDARPGQRGHE